MSLSDTRDRMCSLIGVIKDARIRKALLGLLRVAPNTDYYRIWKAKNRPAGFGGEMCTNLVQYLIDTNRIKQKSGVGDLTKMPFLYVTAAEMGVECCWCEFLSAEKFNCLMKT